ncbi:hypothetical protein [Phenylobacterium montanum]|uniref:Uncharacterized protein n=1 Tax=Phenylobacterium montanum TaxID=2823693 RepID=A0A975IWB2_9CAUL|nr:hypothetical protein [Caulobacter sp. S6]QUD89897.1 hypothetical protein KCG34_08545 [Caulobacter sp. S6]
MRISTLGGVAAAMMALIWMVAASYRPASLYVDDGPRAAPTAESLAAAHPPGRLVTRARAL